MISTIRSRIAAAIGAGLAVLFAAGAQANLVTNGSFEQTTNGAGQLGYNTNLTGWTDANNGYNFVFASGSADTTGTTGQYGNVKLWGPGDGSTNGLPSSSPDGGNFVASDGAYNVGALEQTITGLTKGAQYTVGFWFAGAQQYSYNGATTEQFQVSLGSQTLSTAVLSDISHGFTGWQYDTLTFTADATSDVLAFLAVGTPSGVPPFSLLDGVSMTAVPEPASWAMMLTGLVGMAAIARYRRKSGRAI